MVHRQIGYFIVHFTGNEAMVFCYGIAIHSLTNRTNRNTRTFVGSFEFHLVKESGKWRIDAMTCHSYIIGGNIALEQS